MAWLADPGLFTYSLSIRQTNKGLELHGFVASEPARQKVVAIARALCTGPVIDQLKLLPGMPIQMSRGAVPAELAPIASSALAEALGDKVLALRVVCPSPGRVEVSGSLPTIEDKLLVSKCMKTLSGCTHVVNRTSAPGSEAGAAIVANIPLMMTKSAKDAPTHLNSEYVATSPTPVIMNRPVPLPAASNVPKNELTAAAPRMVVTPPVKPYEAKPDVKFEVVATQPITPGYASISDAKTADETLSASDAVKAPEPCWPIMDPVMPAVVTEPKLAESKPIGVTNATMTLTTPEVRNTESNRLTRDKPQVLNLLPEPTRAPAIMPPVESCKSMDKTCDMTKPEQVAKAIVDVPEAPKPIIVPPILPPVKSQPLVRSPYGGMSYPKAMADLPKPADLPRPLEMPKPVVEVTPIATGKASVTDTPSAAESKEVVQLPKPVSATMVDPKLDKPPTAFSAGKASATDIPPVVETKEVIELPKPVAAPMLGPQLDLPVTAIAAGKASVTDIPPVVETKEVIELPKPVAAPMVAPKLEKSPLAISVGNASVTDIPPVAETKEVIELPKPVPTPPEALNLDKSVPPIVALPKVDAQATPAVEIPKPLPTKVERYSPSACAPVAPVKPVTYMSESSGLRSGKEPVSITLDSETARRAVEDVCRGAGSDLKVTAGPARQLIISMKVANQADWEHLYTKVKALPEINGYSVIYNAQVEGSATKANAPAAATLEAPSVKTTSAPMMGVLRSNASSNSPSAEAAKAAIEKLCDGKATDLSIRTPAGKQVAVTMKVASAADWELLYAQIKALPEIAGCSVIYNISVK
jgi:hypothetical protein